jgi:hypothetical protein
MTKSQVKEILDRVLDWPDHRQQDAARMLMDMEAQDAGGAYRLTDEQIEEVRKRLADPNPKFLSLEEVRARFTRRGA